MENEPSYDFYVKLGDLSLDAGNVKEAIDNYRKALQLNPQSATIYSKLGDAHRRLKKDLLPLAVEFYRKSLALDPQNAEVYNKLGMAQYSLNNRDEAIDAFKKVLKTKPDMLRARFNLAIAQLPIFYQTDGDITLSRQRYRQELETFGELLTRTTEDQIKEAAKVQLTPFYLAYQGHNDCELQSTYGNLLSRIMRERYPQFNGAPLATAIRVGEPIRIGLVSSHFRDHVDWHLIIKGWVENLDKERYQLLGYHTGRLKDEQTELARKKFSRFVEDIHPVEKLAGVIREDRLHVLIYTDVGSNIFSVKLAAMRLAPLQCAAWGHPLTSGLPTIDYFLTNELAEPPGAEDHYTERLVKLPNLSIYYTPPEVGEVTGDRASLGLPAEGVLFLCVQSLFKYLPKYDEVFVRIAKELGKCHFVFKKNPVDLSGQFFRRLKQAFARYGLRVEDYVSLLPRLEIERYYGLYSISDIFLDSIGYSGFTTTLNALLFDLPVITMPGKFMRGRQSLSILTMMGVTETIGDTVDDYVSLAIRLGLEEDWRREIRNKIAHNKKRIYRDMACIKGLEEFIDRAVAQHITEV